MIETLVLVEVVKMVLVCWVLSSWAVDLTNDIDISKLPKNKFLKLIFSLVLYVMSCPKCFSFWFTLVVTMNFYQSAGVSLLIMLVDKLTQNIKTRL